MLQPSAQVLGYPLGFLGGSLAIKLFRSKCLGHKGSLAILTLGATSVQSRMVAAMVRFCASALGKPCCIEACYGPRGVKGCGMQKHANA